MFDVNKIRKDFQILKETKMQGKPFIYFDNAATTLKPSIVVNSISDYYNCYTSSVHRGDYDFAHRVDTNYEKTRDDVARFIGCNSKEVIFTSGTTESLNTIAFGYALENLKKGDEILLTVGEHASNVLPWFEVAKQTQAVIKYIELDNGKITIENVKKAITSSTKIISIAHITNVLGYLAPIKEISDFIKGKNIIFSVDGAQSVAHLPVNVKELNVDFFSFSSHKMCGPTGVGVLYGKYELLQNTKPLLLGGGSNVSFNKDGSYNLKDAPAKFESGTPNIEGVIGFGAAVNYLSAIGMNNIYKYENQLRQYAINEMTKIDKISVYNTNAIGPIIFSVNGVFSQDVASLFNSHGIAVRSGQHCAKIIGEVLPVSQTVRASLSFYNTEDEVDEFIKVCKKGDDFLDAFFG